MYRIHSLTSPGRSPMSCRGSWDQRSLWVEARLPEDVGCLEQCPRGRRVGGFPCFFFSPLKTLTQRTRLEFGYGTKKCPFFFGCICWEKTCKNHENTWNKQYICLIFNHRTEMMIPNGGDIFRDVAKNHQHGFWIVQYFFPLKSY